MAHQEKIDKLFDLIESGTKENIELAFKLAKSQNIDLEKIAIEEYDTLCTFVLVYTVTFYTFLAGIRFITFLTV